MEKAVTKDFNPIDLTLVEEYVNNIDLYQTGFRNGYYEGYKDAVRSVISRSRVGSKQGIWNNFLMVLYKWSQDKISKDVGYEHPPQLDEFSREPVEEKKKKMGCVYFINMSWTNFLKIGYTFNFKKRFNQIKNNVPAELVVLGKDWTYTPKQLERSYHTAFKPYRLKTGEWFEIPDLMSKLTQWRVKLAPVHEVDDEYKDDQDYDNY